MSENPRATQVLRLSDAMAQTGLGRSSIYNLVARGELVPIKLGSVTGFIAAEVDEFVRSRAQARHQTPKRVALQRVG